LYEAPIRIVNKEKPNSYFAVLPGTGMLLEGNSAFFVGYGIPPISFGLNSHCIGIIL